MASSSYGEQLKCLKVEISLKRADNLFFPQVEVDDSNQLNTQFGSSSPTSGQAASKLNPQAIDKVK
jgi:hypothetical protein